MLIALRVEEAVLMGGDSCDAHVALVCDWLAQKVCLELCEGSKPDKAAKCGLQFTLDPMQVLA